ncbi:MAG: tetratricopeptide repeat protein [Planctomycetota bacterium]
MNQTETILDEREIKQRFVTRAGITLAIVAFVSLSIFGIYSFQQGTVARELLRQAKSYHDQGDVENAILTMDRYLIKKPKDVAANIEMAEWMEQVARTPDNIDNLILFQFKTIGLCEASPEHKNEIPALRARAVELLIASGRYEEAMLQIDSMVGTEPVPILLRNMTRCRMGLLLAGRPEPRPKDAMSGDSEWYLMAKSTTPVDLLVNTLFDQPNDLELTRLLAEVCVRRRDLVDNSTLSSQSKEELEQMALQSADRMLAENEKSSGAWLLHASVAAVVDPMVAETDFDRAQTLFPDSINIERAAGLFYVDQAKQEMRSGRPESRDAYLARAEPILKKLAASRAYADLPVFAALGDLHAIRGEHNDAVRIWESGCQICPPPTLELHFRIVESKLASGAPDGALNALTSLDEALNRESTVLKSGVHRDLTHLSKEYWIQYHIAKGDRAALQRMLDSLVKSIATNNIETRAETMEFVAASYMKIGKWEKANEAFQEGLSLKPSEDRLLRGASQASLRSNQITDAIAHLRLIQDKKYNDWILLASLSLENYLRRQDPDERALEITRDALSQARTALNTEAQLPSNPWLIDLLESEVAIRMVSPEERASLVESAVEELVTLCEVGPEYVDLWQTAMLTLNRWGQVPRADALMEKFEHNHPDHELSIVHRAKQLASTNSKEEAREIVWSALLEKPMSDSLLRGYFQLSDGSPAWGSEMNELLSRFSNDADRMAMLGRLAVKVPFQMMRDDAKEPNKTRYDAKSWGLVLQKIEERLRVLEGTEGIEWRTLRARRLLRMAEVETKPDWNQVREIARYLTIKQPSLPTGYMLSGIVLDRANKPLEALPLYQKAIALGESELGIYERACELLYQEGKWDEAKSLIDRLGAGKNNSARVASVALQLSGDQPEQLLEIAKAGIEARPSDPMAWVWNATVLEISSRDAPEDERAAQIASAKESIDRAVALAPEDLRVINAEFNFLGLTGQVDKYPATVERLRDAESILPVQRFVTLGRMEFVLGKLDDSIVSYQEALKAGGDEVPISLMIAQSLRAQRKVGAAIETLEGAYKKSPQQAEVRQMLASVLAERGNSADWSRLQTILTTRPSGNTNQDLSLLASLLAQRGFPADLAKAKSLLEKLNANASEATGEDLFRLGMITFRAANLQRELNNTQKADELWNEAEKYLKQAVSKEPSRAAYRYVYANLLLDRKRWEEGLDQAKILRQIDDQAFESHLILARALHANDDPKGAIATLQSWVEAEREKHESGPTAERLIASLGNAAAGFMLLGLRDQANGLLREMEVLSASASLAILATLTGVEDIRLRSTAIELLLEKAKGLGANSPAVVPIAVVVSQAMSGKKVEADAKAKGDAFLQEIQPRNIEDSTLQRALADYWLIQDQPLQSIECLRALIKLTPEDPVVMNNLACLLGRTEEGNAEGLQWIERAIALVGEVPDLLDSKGIILMKAGKLDEAIAIFENAAKTGEDPRIMLHWYMALRRGNRLKAAKLVQSRIDVERLRRAPLTEEEQKELRSLQ